MKNFTALLLALALCMGMTTLALAEDYESKTFPWSSKFSVDKARQEGEYGLEYHVPVGAVITYKASDDGPFCLFNNYTEDRDNIITIHWSYDPAAGKLVKSDITDSMQLSLHENCPKLAGGETYTITITEELMEDFSVIRQLPGYAQKISMYAGRLVDFGPEYKGYIYFDFPDTTPAGPEQPTVPNAPAPTSVILSLQKLAVDGKDVDCEKYNIDGSNYFKLRDLASLLSGTGSQFEVGYDEASATVSITTGQAYTPNGTELATGVDNSATAQPSSQAILVNGEKNSELTVYNIGGSNFFQLRQLGNVLGFEVDYDGDTNTAIVNSVQK